MATIDVKDAAGSTVAIEKPLVPGRAAAASSRPVALSSEDFAVIDGLETAIASTNTKLDTLHTDVDGLETAVAATNTLLTTQAGYLDGLETATGIVTETAPASDTASSGLNGRLQRIAQRLTSLIALVPAALGQGTMAQSLRVVLPSDQSAVPTTPAGNAASGAADSGNPLKVGGRYTATTPPTLADGNRGDLQLDANGNLRVLANGQLVTGADGIANTQIVTLGNPGTQLAGMRPLGTIPHVLNPAGTLDRMRGNAAGINVLPPPSANQWSFASAASGIVNTTTAVTIKAAGGAGLRNFICSMQIAHDALGGVTELVIRDGAAGTVIWRGKLQVTATELPPIVFNQPLQSTANTLLEVAALTAVTGGIYVNAQGFVAA